MYQLLSPQVMAMMGGMGQGGMPMQGGMLPGGMPMQPGMMPGASPLAPMGGAAPGLGPMGAMAPMPQRPMGAGPMGGMPQPQLPPGGAQGGPQNPMGGLMGAPGGAQQGAIPQLLAALQNLKQLGPNISAAGQYLNPYGRTGAGNDVTGYTGPGGTVGGGV